MAKALDFSMTQKNDGKTRGHRPLVIFDGDCAFCRRCIAWLERHDRRRSLDFAPFQDALISDQLRAACQNAVHLCKSDGQILRAGRAVLFALRFTRWNRLARLLELPPLVWLVELGYCVVARNRPFFSRFF